MYRFLDGFFSGFHRFPCFSGPVAHLFQDGFDGFFDRPCSGFDKLPGVSGFIGNLLYSGFDRLFDRLFAALDEVPGVSGPLTDFFEDDFDGYLGPVECVAYGSEDVLLYPPGYVFESARYAFQDARRNVPGRLYERRCGCG